MRRSGTNYPCSLQGVQINLLTSTSKPPRPAAFHADQELEGRHIRHAVLSCTGSGLGSERAFKMSSALIAVISLSSCTEINNEAIVLETMACFSKGIRAQPCSPVFQDKAIACTCNYSSRCRFLN